MAAIITVTFAILLAVFLYKIQSRPRYRVVYDMIRGVYFIEELRVGGYFAVGCSYNKESALRTLEQLKEGPGTRVVA